MADFYLKSGAGAIVLANRAWTLGDKMVPTLTDATANVALARRWVWEVTTAATSNGTPTWAAAVTQDTTTVTQNSVVWTARKPGFSSGSTVNWSYAAIYMHYIATALAAGDRLFVSNHHAETQGSVNSTSNFPGTLAAPNVILCVDDSATPPTAVATGATVTTTGAFSINISGSLYCYGIVFSAATGGSGANSSLAFLSAAVREVFEKCAFKIGSGVTNTWNLSVTGAGFPAEVVWLDCDMRMNATGQRFRINNVNFIWHGGTYLSGGAADPTTLFTASLGGVGATANIQGVDFSNLASATSICTVQPGSVVDLRLSRCKQSPGGIVPFGGAVTVPGVRATIHGINNSGDLTRLWEEDFAGTIKQEAVLVRTGGSSDGTTPLSWNMSASSAVVYPQFGLRSPQRSIWNDTTGSSKTATVCIIHNGTALLTNAEIYLALDVLTNSGSTKSERMSDGPDDGLTAATNQDTDTSAWDSLATSRANTHANVLGDVIKLASNSGRVFFCTTAGTTAGSEPGGYAAAVDGDSITDGTAVFRAGWRQKLGVTFTPQVKGPVLLTVVLTKASYTVWVDPANAGTIT